MSRKNKKKKFRSHGHCVAAPARHDEVTSPVVAAAPCEDVVAEEAGTTLAPDAGGPESHRRIPVGDFRSAPSPSHRGLEPENRSSPEQNSPAPTLDDRGLEPAPEAGRGNGNVPQVASAPAAEKGRVLLLEDDASFREVIKDWLSENGYVVVAVQNGGEGVREVLANDFTMVLCDINMPGLPGDMFYRALERIRPALCEKFVFMTGYQNDPRTNEFIKDVNGYVLRKPFPLNNLLDPLALAEGRRTFQSTFAGTATGPVLSKGGARVARPPAGEGRRPQFFPVARAVPGSLSPVQASVPAQPKPEPSPLPLTVLPATAPKRRTSTASRVMALAGFAVLIALMAGLWNRYEEVQARATNSLAERRAREVEWKALSVNLEKATAVRSKLELARRKLARMSVEQAKPRWTPVLGGIIPLGDAKIEILEIQARGAAENSGACKVRIRGMAGGALPRQTADRFRQTLEDNLKRNANGRPGTVRLEQLDDVPGEQPDQQRAAFVVTVALGAMESAAVIKKEGF